MSEESTWLYSAIDTFIYNHHGNISREEIEKNRSTLLKKDPYATVFMVLCDSPTDEITKLENTIKTQTEMIEKLRQLIKLHEDIQKLSRLRSGGDLVKFRKLMRELYSLKRGTTE